jgi:3D (Asp-Asp-Asp) domain-containing protein
MNKETVIALVIILIMFFGVFMGILNVKELADDNEKLQAMNYAQEQANQALINSIEKYIFISNGQTFKITHYHADCQEGYCNTTNTTATGTIPHPYWTIAVDPAVIPPGTFVLIENKLYLAEDKGVYGNVIDICVVSHEEAIQLGTYYTDDIFILMEVKP